MHIKRIYGVLNKMYWNGRLPHDTVVEWSEDMPAGSVAASHVHGLSPCDHCWNPRTNCDRSYIRVHPAFRGKFETVAEISIIHEMVHIEALLGNKLLLNHGPSFHRRMKHLAAMGALNGLW